MARKIKENKEEADSKAICLDVLRAVLSRNVPCDSADRVMFDVKMRGRIEGIKEAINAISAMKF